MTVQVHLCDLGAQGFCWSVVCLSVSSEQSALVPPRLRGEEGSVSSGSSYKSIDEEVA